MRKICKVLFCLMFFVSMPMWAQLAPGLGQYAFGTFDSKGPDVINVGNLNVMLNIPVINKPGRAGLNFTYQLAYNSSIWTPTTVSGVETWAPLENWGWIGQTEAVTGYIEEHIHTTTCIKPTGNGLGSVYTSSTRTETYHDAFGISHAFLGYITTGSSECGVIGDTLSNTYSTDGKYKMGQGGYSLSGIDGRITTPPVNVTNSGAAGNYVDSNGNSISTDGQGNFTDTMGLKVLSISGAAPNPTTFTYIDTNGTSQAVTITYREYSVKTNFGCSGVAEYSDSAVYLTDAITDADGHAYHFTYEATPGESGSVTGRLASITLPTGGVISYTYTGANSGIVCADGSLTGLTRSITSADSSPASTWSYTRTVGTSTSHTDVVDGLQNHSAYDFVEVGTGSQSDFYETNRQIYEGAETGTPLLSRQTCYNGAANPCTTTVFTYPISQTDTYISNNGQPLYGVHNAYSTYGMLTEQDTYGEGSSTTARGSLLKKEMWGYYASIPTEVTYDQILGDAGVNTYTATYKYDETTPTATTGIPSHSSVSTVRGNLTSGNIFWGSTPETTYTNTYYDTGVLLSTTAQGSFTTSYSYDATQTFATTITPPTPSSGVSLPTQQTYDSNTGLLLTSTDPNGTKREYSYDGALVPTQIQTVNSAGATVGLVVFNRESTNQTGILQSLSASSSGDIEPLLDAYGRSSRVAIANGQSTNPWYQRDQCYDANGAPSFTSYAYAGNGWGTAKVCNGNGDSYTHDALGRILTVVHPDGTSVIHSYTGLAEEIVDENGIARIIQRDPLGRTKAVCEISSNSTMPQSGSPISCGMDIAGTGFVTTYTYGLAENSNDDVTVTQGAQTRVFQRDWAGRPVSIQEPESGTTTYSYVYNSTGLQVTRKRPAANQTSSTTLTTTTIQYDALGRLLTMTYDDNLTSTKSFGYDVTCCWTNASVPTNVKGRLATTGGGINAADHTGSLYSYDSMGRVIELWQCTPDSCGSASLQASRPITMTYDWAGNLLQEYDPVSGGITYGRSVAGEVTSITQGTYENTYNPAAVVSNVVNGPNGPLSYSLGNGVGVAKSYDSMGRMINNYACVGTGAINCTGSERYVFGNYALFSGNRDTIDCDSAAYNQYGNCVWPHYDDMGRMTSLTGATSQTLYTWTYDRYGNRWSQTGPGNFSASYDTTTNHLNSSPYTYDAAGNLTYDGEHHYTYDAEGNVVDVDLNQGNTASYVYNVWNQRVVEQETSGTYEYLYDPSGLRTSTWNVANDAGIEGRIYWDGKQVAFRDIDGTTYFDHQDYLGTERVRTNYLGATAAQYVSGPWGDGYSANLANTNSDQDSLHFAGLDQDAETVTEHATFRQYSPAQGRWMSPDPYSGSYDYTNPQSMDRYAYVLNNSMSFLDTSGLQIVCYVTADTGVGDGNTVTVTGGTSVCSGSIDYGGDYGSGGYGGGGGRGGNSATAPNNPCANSTLAAAGTTGQQQIATAQGFIAAGKIGASASPYSNPILSFFGGMYGYYEAVHTGGPNDIKNQPGPGYHNQTGVDAGNISFGITCPYGGGFCQFAAGLAQTLSGNPNFNGTLATGYDTPSDNAGIRVGQAMRAAGCHE